MPVTKTAKRALRGSERKTAINKIIVAKLEAAVRVAKKSKSEANISIASSLADRAAKTKTIHRNKAARIKSTLAKLVKTVKAKAPVKKAAKKSAKAKK